MAVPMAILDAAREGDRDTVVAWLDSPGANVNADKGVPRRWLKTNIGALAGRSPKVF